jgi:hypothetical protein
MWAGQFDGGVSYVDVHLYAGGIGAEVGDFGERGGSGEADRRRSGEDRAEEHFRDELTTMYEYLQLFSYAAEGCGLYTHTHHVPKILRTRKHGHRY